MRGHWKSRQKWNKRKNKGTVASHALISSVNLHLGRNLASVIPCKVGSRAIGRRVSRSCSPFWQQYRGLAWHLGSVYLSSLLYLQLRCKCKLSINVSQDPKQNDKGELKIAYKPFIFSGTISQYSTTLCPSIARQN